MSALTNIKWKVMPCPKNAGRHPYHDHRWIVTEDGEVEFSRSGLEWAMAKGSLVCQMMDVDPKFSTLIAAAPELLHALVEIANGSKLKGRWLDEGGNECEETAPGAQWHEYDEQEQVWWLESVAQIASEAVAKATGGAK